MLRRIPPLPSVPDLFTVMDDSHLNDTTAFTMGIAAAVAQGSKVLFIPSGTYTLSPSISITTDITIIGNGDTTILKWAGSSGVASLIKCETNVINVTFRNLTIDGNYQNNTDGVSYMAAIDFLAPNGSRLLLDNVKFINGRTLDVRVVGPTTVGQRVSFEMRDCRFLNGSEGTATRGSQAVAASDGVEFTANNIYMNSGLTSIAYGRAGIVVQSTADNLARGSTHITNVDMRYMGRPSSNALGCIYIYSGADSVLIDSINLYDCYGCGLTVKTNSNAFVVNAVSIYNLTNASAGHGVGAFADVYDNTARCGTISNIVINGSDGQGIFLDGDNLTGANQFSGLQLANVNLYNIATTGIMMRYLDSVTFTNIQIDGATTAISYNNMTGPFKISDCMFENISGDGIFGNGAQANLDLIICDTKLDAIGANGIRTPAIKSFHIRDNILSNITSGAIIVPGSTVFSTVKGNVAISVGYPIDFSGTHTLVSEYDNDFTVDMGYTGLRSITIATGAITVKSWWHSLDTEAAAATDDLDTINGGYEGRKLTLTASNSARTVVVKDGTGNLRLNGDFTMDHADDTISLIYMSSVWRETSRSDNTV